MNLSIGMKKGTEKTTAQEKWVLTERWDREKMLLNIGYSVSFAKLGWTKLPYLVKDNLTRLLDKTA
jgi:hypothetical protein